MTEREWNRHFRNFRAWKERKVNELASEIYTKSGIDCTQAIRQLCVDDLHLFKIYEKELSQNDKPSNRTA